ncbi:MAG TPA: hypothetical protein PLN38_06360, partial [Chitinophagales bacterium]|nr:hypothetical protein [Chitinophagales bacterium]
MLNPNKQSGLLFDGMAILTGLIMFTRVKEYFYNNYTAIGPLPWEITCFITIGVICYTLGLWFYKNHFLKNISETKEKKHGVVHQISLLVLTLMHFAIFCVLAVVIADSWQVVFPSNFLRFVFYGLIGGLPNLILIWTFYRYQTNQSNYEINNINITIGNILLSISAIFIQVLFWNVMTIPMLQNLQVESFYGRVIFAGLFFFLFLLIYLPPRLFYFIVDYPYTRTWM